MDKKTLKTLEFDLILDHIASYTKNALTKDYISKLEPLSNIQEINYNLDKLDEICRLINDYCYSFSVDFDGLGNVLSDAAILNTLTIDKLYYFASFLNQSEDLFNYINELDDSFKIIKEENKYIYTNKSLRNRLFSSILSLTELNDNASIDLLKIRKGIKSLTEQIRTKLNTYITDQEYTKCLQDNIVTIRENRYVIPLKIEFKGQIPGLIHDQSDSGQTIYVEPYPIVELNNDLKQLMIQEKVEIDRILYSFTQEIYRDLKKIQVSFENLINLDIFFSKAQFSIIQEAVKPTIVKTGNIKITNGRHPLIPKNKVVSNSIEIDHNTRILVITGPNTGGKTVFLKMVGLFELMGLSGLFIPADNAILSIYDDIYCDIGDSQSIENNLSTFSSHINNIIGITENVTNKSLVLIDELGIGTDPIEGSALAVSIAQFLLDINCKAIITTHFYEMKNFAITNQYVLNASMAFDSISYKPTYKLVVGQPGTSNAFIIAEQLGLNKMIINNAKNNVGKDKVEYDTLMADLNKKIAEIDIVLEKTIEDKKQIEEEKTKLIEKNEKLDNKYKEITTQTKKEINKSLNNYLEEADDIIKELKDCLKNSSNDSFFKAQKLRKNLEDLKANDIEEGIVPEGIPGDIKVNDSVYVKSLSKDGIVTSILSNGNQFNVKIGLLSTIINADDLIKIKNNKEKSKITTRIKLNNENIPMELNVIGLTSMEAIDKVDKYLAKAREHSLSQVTIIHGLGKGILRNTIQNYLKGESYLSFRDGEYGEGGKGVTIVIFKK